MIKTETINFLEDYIKNYPYLNSHLIKMTIFDCNINEQINYFREFGLQPKLETNSEIHFDIFRDAIEISFFNIEPLPSGIKIHRWEDMTADLVDRERLLEAIDKYVDYMTKKR
ncbi:hypothetical protein MHB65_07200 [Lysinibacillus sp. FSL K6-0075]|uniref:hypothetical protein n=1 Tax=Lysinibacillus sp. FSL K6-0075 TaxID=2921415 RepID=UPI003159928E